MEDNGGMDLLEELAKAEREKGGGLVDDARFDRARRELSPQEELRRQHMVYHQKHKGHEQMHAGCVLN